MNPDFQVDKGVLSQFLNDLIDRQLEESAKEWLNNKLAQLIHQPQPKDLYLTFSAIPRFLGKEQIELDDQDHQRAHEIRPGLSLKGWSITQTARVLTICSYSYPDPGSYLKILDQIFSAAEVSELVALYSALPLLPYPEKLKPRASEGIRTNMSVVFDAVVLNNPYPSEYLDEGAWNQMVLKALFMGRPLYQVYGLEARCNPQLTKMISNFAHERWVAGRPTSPEMWRPIGDQGTISIYQDLEKLIEMDDPDQQTAAVLAAGALKTKEAQMFLDHHASEVKQVNQSNADWDEIGKRWWSNQNQN